MANKTELTTQEQQFVDLLFDGSSMRHPDEAKVLAGYPQDYPYLSIIKRVKEVLIERYDDFLAAYAPKGLKGLMDVIDSPETPGTALRLKAVTELLDRAGVVRKEKTEVEKQAPSYIFYLPNKVQVDATEK